MAARLRRSTGGASFSASPLSLPPICTPETRQIVVTGILAGPVDQQVFLLVNQILTIVFAHFKIGRELDRVGRTRFFAVAAKDASGEIDAEEFGITAPVFIFRRLQRDAIHRASDAHRVAGNASLAAIRIARENDPPPVAWRQIRLLFRILDRYPPLKGVEKHVPDRSAAMLNIAQPTSLNVSR